MASHLRVIQLLLDLGKFHFGKVKITNTLLKIHLSFIFSSLKERLLTNMGIKVSIAAIFITKTNIVLNEFSFIKSAIANMGFLGLRKP